MIRPRGFTLIELMIVVAICGILVSIVLPALLEKRPGCHYSLEQRREAEAYRTCLNNRSCVLSGEQFARMDKIERACSTPAASTNATTTVE